MRSKLSCRFVDVVLLLLLWLLFVCLFVCLLLDVIAINVDVLSKFHVKFFNFYLETKLDVCFMVFIIRSLLFKLRM